MSQAPTPDRRQQLREARAPFARFPVGEYFELPGRPNVIYTLTDYGRMENGVEVARREVPFLFKAFETGQMRPPRPGTKAAEEPRASTIHEYLDWTVTAAAGGDNDDELDFGGFRTVLLVPRFRPSWPPPGVFDSEAPKRTTELGAPRCPLPLLLPKSKPVSAATVRCGPGYLEVPFFATHDSHRNQGFGRALLEALEDIARACNLPRMLLCSTDDPLTRNTWRHLGFVFSQEADLQAFDVHHGDLLHMDNTVQMHKTVPPARPWKSIVIRHDQWAQRAYYPPTPDALTGPLLDSATQQNTALQSPGMQQNGMHVSAHQNGALHGGEHEAKANGDDRDANRGHVAEGSKRALTAALAAHMPLNEEARALLGNILIVPDGEATEMTDATDLTAGEQVQQHAVQAWQAPVNRATSQWQAEGLEVTGPAQRWRGFGDHPAQGIAVALPH
ncbi:hypothetical protein WJX73_009212 [Symbiochloris irregularis]|uniref:N-acetyltransferase domain-containing protein n=1 Tax=Symbiochloris irregularis TaxID=706552 RepID=A0AAW1P7W6_9CHLO